MTLEEAETLALSTLKQVMEEKVHSDGSMKKIYLTNAYYFVICISF